MSQLSRMRAFAFSWIGFGLGGPSKEKACIDLWLKDIAPSDKLRKSFGHDPSRWDEFVKKYENELRKKKTLSRS